MKPIVIVVAAGSEERMRLVLRTRAAGARDAIPLPPNGSSLHSWTRGGSFCLRRGNEH